MVRHRQGMLLQEIAAELHVDRNTVTAAVRYSHESRGIPVPDGRRRRRDLEVKTSPKEEKEVSDLRDDPPEKPTKANEDR